MHTKPKLAGALAGAVGLALLIGACSSSGGQAGSSASAQAATSSDSKGVAAAKQFLAPYTKVPTSVGALPALASKPPTGKHLALLTNSLPIGVQVGVAAKAAAASLGWTLTSIDVGSTTATAVSAFQAALAMHPAAILDNGEPAALFTAQLAKAKAEGIPYFEASTADPPTSGVAGIIGGGAYSVLTGKIMAAEFVADTGGHGNAVYVTLPAFPVMGVTADSFSAAVKQWCPSCGVKVLDQELTDVGTSTPSNLVGFLNANPTYKWAVFGIGDLDIGVPAALQTAGIKGIQIMSNAPNVSDIDAIKAGSEVAAVTYSTDDEGWELVDLAARAITHANLAPALKVLYPTMLLTKANAANATIEGGYFVAPVDYQAEFKKLWKVTS
jgi:ribose transport system substrate-binding protein